MVIPPRCHAALLAVIIRLSAHSCRHYPKENLIMNIVSNSRRHLASFDNAYAIAVRLKETTGTDQYVVKTPDASRLFRVSQGAPRDRRTIVSLIA
jgi:hypothetical protein